MSNVGKWDTWYLQAGDSPFPYGPTSTYMMGANYLNDCKTVEDRGCGGGWFKQFRPDVVGIDGSHSKFADVVCDLETYVSSPEGIFMRHVLEHNYGWANVLASALDSFTRKMVLVLFTPLVDETRQIAFVDAIGVPDMAFKQSDLTDLMDQRGLIWELETIEPSATAYGVEHLFRIRRP